MADIDVFVIAANSTRFWAVLDGVLRARDAAGSIVALSRTRKFVTILTESESVKVSSVFAVSTSFAAASPGHGRTAVSTRYGIHNTFWV